MSIVTNQLRDMMAKRPDPAYCGSVFDQLIAIAMRSAAMRNVKPSFLSKIPWASEFQWTGSKRLAILDPLEDTLKAKIPVCEALFSFYNILKCVCC